MIRTTMPAVFVALSILCPWVRGQEVTLQSLIGELTDLSQLAEFPSPPYVTRQSSSYDRASTSSSNQGTWFANADRGHYIRVETRGERKEFVMLDAPGPGAVVRIWSANPEGTLRIYIDEDERPALEAPMGDLLRGKVKPFTPPIAYEASRGCNIYFPFSYARHCKITSDKGNFYYQVNYRSYPKAVRVESYAAAKVEALEKQISRVRDVLSHPEKGGTAGPRARRKEFALSVTKNGDSRLTIDRAGPKGGVIRALVLRPSSIDPESLRGTLLTATFDGKEAVRAPLGDLFGSGPGWNPYDSLPLSVSKDGTLTSRWLMPFRESATLAIHGLRAERMEVRGHVLHEPYPWGRNSLYFHAKWRAEHGMKTAPPRDWNYVAVTGKGVYAGNVLNIANPVKAWWGEGDEKIYVDGETFPSHFGTGTEDYYGYAWCCPEPFCHALHNQTRCDGPGNFGYTSVNRWHVIDNIPFTKSFRFDMEVWHWNRKIEVSYDTVNFWYAQSGSKDNVQAVGPETLRVPVIPERKVKVIPGAVEGEKMRVVERTGGTASGQDMTAFEGLWSREEHLWWRHAKPGDRLVLAFDARKAGRYRITAHLTKAVDYGIHQLSVNGKKAGEPIDLWNDGVIPFQRNLGSFDLELKGNRLEVEVTGSNPKARPKYYMFGLDCLVLEE